MVRLGPYEVLIKLAAGGAANVFLAREMSGEHPRLLALKVMHPHLAANPQFQRMFFAEAKIASQLRHANIVGISGFGENDGVHCLAMEYVFGTTLRDAQRRGARQMRPLGVGVLLRVTAAICRALHYAHDLADEQDQPLGLVHRDVTPQNIMIGFNGAAKLTDFGIAKATNRGWETTVGIVKGKFSYMAPEQALGRKVDRRTDVFCLGIVLWEALTGRELFEGTTPKQILDAIQTNPIPPPSAVAKGLAPIVDGVVMKALERAPTRRYLTAQEMAEAIDALIASVGLRIAERDVAAGLAAIFGEEIPRRALALRQALAGEIDEAELAEILGGEVLVEEEVEEEVEEPSHPARRKTAAMDRSFIPPVDDLVLEPARGSVPPAPPERELAASNAAERTDKTLTPPRIDPLHELLAMEPELDVDVDMETPVGWDSTQVEVMTHDLLEMITLTPPPRRKTRADRAAGGFDEDTD